MLVTNFVQLVAARIAAAVGEAGCFPTAYSLLGDYFPAPADRTRAMAVFMLATPLSSLLGYIVGGWLNEHYGWRYAFFLIGLPGLVLVLLIRLTVKEPRAARPGAMNRTQSAPPLATVVSVLWRQRSSRHLSIALILLYLMALGLAPWYAAFMVRSHGMETTELGIWLGLLFGIGGSVGTVLGGYLAARWFPDDARGQMRLSAIMIAAVVPCFFLFLLLPAKRDALLALLPLLIILHIFIGPTFALMQRLVADEIRASTLAVVLLLANLIGMGIGPQAVGILSDLLGERFGSDSLRYAMLGMSFIALWSAFHFWQVGETADADLGQVPAIQRT
jgi:predicted MFS family arabinose efflux permease